MGATTDLKQLITEGIKDLPHAALTEVADFVIFIRHRALERQPFDTAAIQKELQLMQTQALQHLEAEFSDFDKRFPKE